MRKRKKEKGRKRELDTEPRKPLRERREKNI